jgi:hypothetical protein
MPRFIEVYDLNNEILVTGHDFSFSFFNLLKNLSATSTNFLQNTTRWAVVGKDEFLVPTSAVCYILSGICLIIFREIIIRCKMRKMIGIRLKTA